jgi:uncharacterized protein involved in exopolysaccharide biosynthesis
VNEVFSALADYKRMIFLLCISAVVNAVVITYVLTEKFEATSLVLIRPQSIVKYSSTANSKELLNFPIPINIPFKAAGQTYSEVITSRPIAEKIVRVLGLDTPRVETVWWRRMKSEVKQYLMDAWTFLKYGRIEKESYFDTTVAGVQKSLSAVPTRDTYVFEIKFTAKEPQVAAAVANTAAAELVEYIRETDYSEASSTRQFLADQLTESGKTLELARRNLQGFKEQGKITDLREELGTKLKESSEFETSLINTRRDAQATEAEINEIQRQLAEKQEFLKSSYKVTDNPLVTTLKSDLAALEIDLSGRVKRLGPEHPDILSLQARISETNKKLSEEQATITSEETSSVSNVFQLLLADQASAETRLKSLRAKEASLAKIVARQRGELREYPNMQAQSSKLELDLEVATDTYRLIKKEYEDARIREAEKISEIRVISPAVAPTYPKAPIKAYYAGVSLLIALIAGIGAALLLEYIGNPDFGRAHIANAATNESHAL